MSSEMDYRWWWANPIDTNSVGWGEVHVAMEWEYDSMALCTLWSHTIVVGSVTSLGESGGAHASWAMMLEKEK
jgi:hypothetical protein